MTKVSKTLVGAGLAVTGMIGGATVTTVATAAPSTTAATGSARSSGSPGSAGPDTAPTPVGSGQGYTGLVNGSSGSATIDVVCPGPVTSGQTGHPAPKQTIGIQMRAPAGASPDTGFTGGRATSIDAKFVPISSVNGASIEDMFSYYSLLPVPTTLQLPCSGTSTVAFWPRPRTPSTRNLRVAITFQAVCGTTCSKGRRTPPRL